MTSSLQPCGQRKMENHWTLKVLQLTFQVLLGLSSMVQQMMQVARFMKPSSMIVKPVKMSKNCVEQFQSHKCRFTCFKKKKFLKIQPREGHGRFDGVRHSTEIQVPVCRFKFPKNVCDESIFLHIFPTDYPKELLKKAKEDYMKIRKYLLRFSHEMSDMDPAKVEKFKGLTFYEFLYEVGMFEDGQDQNNKVFQQKAKERYLTALRCAIKSSGFLLIKRTTQDIFTNNFNKVYSKFMKAIYRLIFLGSN